MENARTGFVHVHATITSLNWHIIQISCVRNVHLEWNGDFKIEKRDPFSNNIYQEPMIVQVRSHFPIKKMFGVLKIMTTCLKSKSFVHLFWTKQAYFNIKENHLLELSFSRQNCNIRMYLINTPLLIKRDKVTLRGFEVAF